jgi:beta-fructofuranosidase
MDPARYAEEMMAVRREMAGDPHRPQYHFQSPSNWVNDAHPIYWEGRYHMFYLYNPYGVTHGIVHWAHAVSDDLVHWTDWPIAMYPDTPYDKEGVRSGNVFINDDGVPTAIYTGSNGVTPNPVREQFGMLATSTDGMLTWQKHPVPVIPEPPYPGTPAHHDAQIWKDGDTWYQLVGGSYEGNGAAVLHSSKDLLQWSYAGRIFTGEDGKRGVFWELPYLLPYGRKDVMIIGIHPVPYFVGSYDKERREFTPEKEGVLDYGTKIYYAPNPHMVDDKGEGGSERRIMIGWVREVEGSPAPGSGWNGMFSIPRIVTLLPDDNLAFDPAPELEVLRRDHRRFEEVPLDGTSTGMLEGVRGDSLEIRAEFHVDGGANAPLGLKLRRSPGGEEETRLFYDPVSERLVLDPLRSSRLPGPDRPLHEGPLALGPDGTLTLRVFLDHSVIEVYANRTACITGRIYPSRSDSLGVDVFAGSGGVRLRSLDTWQMASIW